MTLSSLCPSERTVVQLRADYYTLKEIARIRGCSVSTVQVHLDKARQKFEARSMGELLRRVRAQMEAS